MSKVHNLSVYQKIAKKYSREPTLNTTMPREYIDGYEYVRMAGPLYRIEKWFYKEPPDVPTVFMSGLRVLSKYLAVYAGGILSYSVGEPSLFFVLNTHNFTELQRREPAVFRYVDDFYRITARLEDLMGKPGANAHLSDQQILKNRHQFHIFPMRWAEFMQKQRAMADAIIKKFRVAGTFSAAYKSAFYRNAIPEEFMVSRSLLQVNKKDPLCWFNLDLKLCLPANFRLNTKYPNKYFAISDHLCIPYVTAPGQYEYIYFDVNGFESLNAQWDQNYFHKKLLEFLSRYRARVTVLQNWCTNFRGPANSKLWPDGTLIIGGDRIKKIDGDPIYWCPELCPFRPTGVLRDT
jgi:hypothetical protein